jgi:hypothetical protein
MKEGELIPQPPDPYAQLVQTMSGEPSENEPILISPP